MHYHSARSLILGFALAAGVSVGDGGWAQTQPPAMAVERVTPLSSEKRLAIEKATLADTRIRAVVGAGQARVITTAVEVDKAEAEAYLAGTSLTPPTLRVTVVVFNAQTNKAARALVAAEQNRILAVESIGTSDVPFSQDDAAEALALAKANPAVRQAIGESLDRFTILHPGDDAKVPFAAQTLPMRSTNPQDACTVDRCLDVIFRTEVGYLSVRAHVNLTKKTVTVRRGGQHQ